MAKAPDQTAVLLDRLRAGAPETLGELFGVYRDRLWRMVRMRLDRRLAGRVDADDVLQEAFLDVARRIDEYLAEPTVPFYVWVRFLTGQRLLLVQRNHLGARRRDARQEVPLPHPGLTPASSESMAGAFVSRLTSPSRAAMRQELQEQLREALDALDPLDREVLALRHFEELSNQETADVLGLTPDAASKRHIRALKRLKGLLAVLPGGLPG